MSDVNLESKIRKIKSLLKLGESSNENEASIAISKAHELLLEYNLSLKDLEINDIGIIDAVFMEGGKARHWKLKVVDSVCKLNFCLDYYSSMRDRLGNIIKYSLHIVGKPHNVECSKEMINYLFDTVERLSKRLYGRETIASYKDGISDKLAIRIQDMMMQEASKGCDCKDLVKMEKADVDNYMKGMKLGTKKLPSKATDWEGYAKGMIDGAGISLSPQIRENGKQVVLGIGR